MKFMTVSIYISKHYGCSAKTLRRLRHIGCRHQPLPLGERANPAGTANLLRLAQGICAIAAESDYSPAFRRTKFSAPSRFLHTEKSDFDSAVQNLKNLLTHSASATQTFRAMNFDASYLSRVCSGQRKPANTEEFITQVCRYVTRQCLKNDKPSARSSVHPQSNLQSQRAIHCAPHWWLCTAKQRDAESVSKFLAHLDTFDLNEYIEAIHFGGD